MINYTKLVETLRWTANEYKGSVMDEEDKDTIRSAADAIEDMAKHITEMHERVTVLQIDRGKLEEEVDALKHDIEKYVQINTELTTDNERLEFTLSDLQDRCIECAGVKMEVQE